MGICKSGKLQQESPYNSYKGYKQRGVRSPDSSSTLGGKAGEMTAHSQRKTLYRFLITDADLPKVKTKKCPLIDESLNEMWSIYSVEYYAQYSFGLKEKYRL